jgi:hypothetical protein
MAVYTVHEPLLRATEASADPERFVFVRDGFYVWAFLLTSLWMLWRRLWLVLVGYIVVLGALDIAMVILGASQAVVVLGGVLISLFVGLEASTLRRFTLRRRGWKNVGIVSGDDAEDAEWRFFDAWARTARAQPVPRPPKAGLPSAPVPRLPQGDAAGSSGVIGLFPEPGVQR